MALIFLITILLIGGALAWGSERFGQRIPKLVSIATIIVAFNYLLSIIISIPAKQFSLVPAANNANTWLLNVKLEWIPRFGINFELAMDGLSLVLVLLTLVLGGIAVVSSWTEDNPRQGFFQANILWTLAGVIGVFLALDLFLFFLFWEVIFVDRYLGP